MTISLTNFKTQKQLLKVKFSYEISFRLPIPVFQANSVAISEDQQNSIKSFQSLSSICSRMSKKANQKLNKFAKL